jgi:eukaryotic-like serine/threonine-protein kinase
VTATTQAKQIFLDALDRPPDQRDAFVGDACGGDDALRARVTSLLSSHDGDEGILDATIPIGTQLLDDIAAVAPAPRQIGSYQLLRLLGRGGCGVVWFAEQQHPIRRQVALKLLHPSLVGFAAHPSAARDVIARFEAERQALAMMEHPHIAHVIAAGTVPDGPHAGQPYFAMEYVDGPPITRYCDDHSLALRQRLELFVKVCMAVQHAHQKGVIHRDLKPGNVLVATIDGVATPKVIDFGVAKAVGDRAGARRSTTLTRQSQLIGTPQYMSPEQARSGIVQIDTRSDVYSLGAMLYEILTGAVPLDARAVDRGDVEALRKMVCEQIPARPSLKIAKNDPRRRGDTGRVRGDLDWIVMKALEKEPHRRYQTPADLARDVERHLVNEPVTARPPSIAYRLRKLARRHRTGLIAGVLAIAPIAMIVTFYTWRAVSAGREQARQIQQRVEEDLHSALFTLSSLTEAQSQVGRAPESLAIFENQLMPLVRSRYQPWEHWGLRYRGQYSTMLARAGKLEEAQRVLDEVLADAKAHRTLDARVEWSLARRRMFLHEAAGRKEDAEAIRQVLPDLHRIAQATPYISKRSGWPGVDDPLEEGPERSDPEDVHPAATGRSP